MKTHTNNFKNGIILHGREIDSRLTYQLNGETIELGNQDLNSVTPSFKGNILKSIMKQLDVDSNVNIPVGTIINYQFGLKIGNSYEYLNYGNYIVNKSERQEDTNSYLLTCYDKMLYSMVDYEDLGITYPITIQNYINAICNKLGLTFKNASSTFANYDKEIQEELYLDNGGNSLDYTFRDVLDELAQATASMICINEEDELEVRYFNDTHDTVDENYFKNVNVGFGEKYGPINSIVLSRSAETDNVYLQDQTSITQNGLCELKIIDNQILNWNDRSTYLPDMFAKLGGLEYYLNDFSSTGICYYELGDKYTAHIGDNDYLCIMFNDEVLITQGLQENIYTERPKESETDYSTADKTDRKINQTYLIVDKQNGTISSVVSQTIDTSNPNSLAYKQSKLTQRVDSLESAISDIADLTVSGESSYASVDLDRIGESEPIMIIMRGTSTNNIAYSYPCDNIFPSNNTYIKNRKLRFYNKDTEEVFDYDIPDDLLYYDENNYDEFYLDYESQTCQITKKCKFNSDGTVGLLSSSTINSYTYPYIALTEGDYRVTIYGQNSGYLFVRLMSKNIYTSQFYTKAETNSLISQTSQEIDLSVDTKLSNYSTTNEMNSAITIKANEINSSVSETYATKTTTNQLSSRISQTAKNIELSVNNGSTTSGITITTTKEDGSTAQAVGTIQMNGLVSFTNLSTSGQTTINGANIQTGTLSANKITTGTFSANMLSSGTMSASDINIYNGTGFFKMLHGSAYHPYVSALNVASYADSPSSSGAGISFRSAKNRNSTGSQIGYISYGANGGCKYHSNGAMNIESGGNIGIDGGYVRVKNMYISTDALRFYANNSTTAQIVSGGSSIYIKPKSDGKAYVGEKSDSNRIATSSSGPSSLNVKTDLKKIDLNKVYEDFKKINVYDYKYKYKNLNNPYGFIIDEIEKQKALKKYFKNYDVKKEVVNDKLLPVNEKSKKENIINVKEWDRDSYIKGMFVVMKSMQEEIDKLKEEVRKLKESDK